MPDADVPRSSSSQAVNSQLGNQVRPPRRPSVAGNRNYTHFLRSRSFHRAGTISLDRPSRHAGSAAGPLLLLCERSASDFEEAPYRVASELYGIAQILSERALGII